MLSLTDQAYHEAVALMEQVNQRLLDGRLARMRIRYRSGRSVAREVLDDQTLVRLVPAGGV